MPAITRPTTTTTLKAVKATGTPAAPKVAARATLGPTPALKQAIARQTGSVSGFEAPRPSGKLTGEAARAAKSAQDSMARRTGSGTADDSIGRKVGTADDSIGRKVGTADDSIGRKSGTADDSIGGKGGSAAGLSNRPADYTLARLVAKKHNVSAPGLKKDQQAAAQVAVEGLSKQDQQAVMKALKNPFAYKAARAAFLSDNFKNLSAADRSTVVRLSTTSDAGLQSAAKLLAAPDNKKLLATDLNGTRALDHLARMLDHAPKGVAGQVFKDLAFPGLIRQGSAPTCTATTIQYEAAKHPGEYARLMDGLSVDGQVKMLGGDELRIDVKAALASSHGRTASGALFQPAVMDYANGAEAYDLKKAQSQDAGGLAHRGLKPDQIIRVTGQVAGVDYRTENIMSDGQAAQVLAGIMSRETPARPVLFSLDMGKYNHCVALEGVDDRHVYFHDPTSGDDYKMTREQFTRRLTSVQYAAPASENSKFLVEKYGRRTIF